MASDPKKDEPSERESASKPERSDMDAGSDAALNPSKKARAAADATEGAQEADVVPEKRGRLSRLRFSKKKDMPGGLWLKCESCSEVIFRKELEEKGRVCPSCGFHFTVPGRERRG